MTSTSKWKAKISLRRNKSPKWRPKIRCGRFAAVKSDQIGAAKIPASSIAHRHPSLGSTPGPYPLINACIHQSAQTATTTAMNAATTLRERATPGGPAGAFAASRRICCGRTDRPGAGTGGSAVVVMLVTGWGSEVGCGAVAPRRNFCRLFFENGRFY